MVGIAWLTINRSCNFKCSWCYAEGTNYSKDLDMPFDMAKGIVDLLKDQGAKTIVLLGGEPTFYQHLFELVDYIHNKGMSSTIITNGYRFHDKQYLDKVVNSNLGCISISIKAGNRQQYIDFTKNDAYEKMKKAIRNVSKIRNKSINYSITVTKDNIDNIEELVALAAIDKNRPIGLSFCSNTFNDNKKPVYGYMCNPRDLVKKIIAKYESIDKAANGRFSIEQSLPDCIWPKEFIEKLIEKGQVSSGCHLQKREGIVFDTEGNIIPCNRLWCFPLGKFGKDFTTKEEFEKFWMREDIVEVYDKLMSYPTQKCIKCDDYKLCGGGCPIQWFILNPNEIIPDGNR